MRSLIPVLNGQHRKAPLFLLVEDVAPDAGGMKNVFFAGDRRVM